MGHISFRLSGTILPFRPIRRKSSLCKFQKPGCRLNFPEDDDKVVSLIHKAVEQGSGIGVLVAMQYLFRLFAAKYIPPRNAFWNKSSHFDIFSRK